MLVASERLETRRLLSAALPELVRDINAAGLPSDSSDFVEVGEVLFFRADDGVHGRELWKSDGTAAGTVMVRDINPGRGDSYPFALVDVSGTLFFVAQDGLNGFELWKSDGTEAGTVLVRDINPGGFSSIYDFYGSTGLVNVNGTLFFAADDGVNGEELWKSDGTEAGTVLVRDIYPGSAGSLDFSRFQGFTHVNGVAFFSANDGVHGVELWRSDGTEAGTVLVRDIRQGTFYSAVPLQLTNINGTLFFAADDGVHGRELWKSDGTEAGTVLVRDILPGPGSGLSGYINPSLTDVRGTLFFAANDGVNGYELWKSDGTEAGTVLVRDVRAGPSSAFYNSVDAAFTDVHGTLFFVADDGVSGHEVWKSDGTEAGTALVRDIRQGADSALTYLPTLTAANGSLFFVADDGLHGYELWKSDGTEAGTVLVRDSRAGTGSALAGYSAWLTSVGGALLFAADDGVHGRELWRSDGTTAGTALVRDIRDVGSVASYPNRLTKVGSTLFFTATDEGNGFELWKSDGTTAGTVLVRDIRPGSADSGPRDLVDVDGTLFFTADDGVHGRELWKSDGTAAGTVMVRDVRAGSVSAFANFASAWLTNVNGTLFFVAAGGLFDYELWMSDGTAEGTVLVRDIRAGSASSNPSFLTSIGGMLFFRADDGVNGSELWKSDGTAAGTALVRDILPGARSGLPSYDTPWLTDVNGHLFFAASDGASGFELWRSDGTSAGTALVRDIRPGGGGSNPWWLTNVNGTLFFSASDGVSGVELWKSDGTEAGTILVRNIMPGAVNASPVLLTDVNGTLFFSADGGASRRELWKSDGTEAGTVLVRDIWVGGASSYPSYLTNVNGVLLFTAEDGANGIGRELWQSDGTEAGTVLVADILPGLFAGSDPRDLINVGGTAFFSADDGVHGRELWRVSAGDTTPPAVSASAFAFETGHSIAVTFDEDVDAATLAASDLTAQHAGGESTFPASSVRYDPATRTATFVFGPPLPDGDYTATIARGAVSDRFDNLLAEAHDLPFFILAGDANRDRVVDVSDLGIMAENWRQPGRTFSQGDFNYNGVVDISDLQVLSTNWQAALPAAPAPAAFAPTAFAPGRPASPFARRRLIALLDG